MRLRAHVVLPSLAAALAAGCGTTDDAAPQRPAASPAPPGPATSTLQSHRDRCAEPTPAAPMGSLSASEARPLVDRASVRVTRRGGRIRTTIVVRAGRLPPVRGTLDATRRGRVSSGTLQWIGVGALVLPDVQLRIARDRLQLRTTGVPRQQWRDLGSASGVALDVGRELLDHPFLLEVRSARGTRADFEASLEAPPATLREYVTNERRGPVTELLRATRKLTLTVRVVDGVLRWDRFVLHTDVPASVQVLGPLRGRSIVALGSTIHC